MESPKRTAFCIFRRRDCRNKWKFVKMFNILSQNSKFCFGKDELSTIWQHFKCISISSSSMKLKQWEIKSEEIDEKWKLLLKGFSSWLGSFVSWEFREAFETFKMCTLPLICIEIYLKIIENFFATKIERIKVERFNFRNQKLFQTKSNREICLQRRRS